MIAAKAAPTIRAGLQLRRVDDRGQGRSYNMGGHPVFRRSGLARDALACVKSGWRKQERCFGLFPLGFLGDFPDNAAFPAGLDALHLVDLARHVVTDA